MRLSIQVGGARSTFAAAVANEVAGVLDRAFGAEGEWEREDSRHFGAVAGPSHWDDFQARAAHELGPEEVPNILAVAGDGRGAYLPANVQAISLPMSDGPMLRCASLPGLRRELAALADRWGLPLDDPALREFLRDEPESGDQPQPLPTDMTVQVFARLTMAANEAVRRDCPLWLCGGPDPEPIDRPPIGGNSVG